MVAVQSRSATEPDTRLRHVLVTGGLGFIGSHCCITLLESGYEVTVFDDLSNSSEDVWERMQYIAGQQKHHLHFMQGDLKRMPDLERTFAHAKYDAVIHCAGRKYVGESVTSPYMYYTNNVLGTLNLVAMMRKVDCKNMVFSSSCTVYGAPQYVPLDEQHPLNVVSPYGRTKLIVEDMFRDFSHADQSWRVILLRYFNPVGAHASGLIGEEQKGFPNNLMPFVQEVIKGNRPHLNIYGNDYNTVDGTPVRDYIHILDLASAHVAAVEKLWATPDIGCVAYNVGTGVGTSVLQIIDAFEKASGKKVTLKFGPRREGDTEAVWAATELSQRELNWQATRGLADMCRDLWAWMQRNPDGYDTPLAQAIARPLPGAPTTFSPGTSIGISDTGANSIAQVGPSLDNSTPGVALGSSCSTASARAAQPVAVSVVQAGSAVAAPSALLGVQQGAAINESVEVGAPTNGVVDGQGGKQGRAEQREENGVPTVQPAQGVLGKSPCCGVGSGAGIAVHAVALHPQ